MLHLTTALAEGEAVAALTQKLEQAAVIKGQRAHYLARKMLATGIETHDAFLASIAATYGRVVARRLQDAFWLAELELAVGTEDEGAR